MRALYSFSDFLFDCYLRLKITDNSIKEYPIKTYNDPSIKLLVRVAKFCINLKIPNFYIKNWIKCSIISGKFNEIANNNMRGVDSIISMFKKFTVKNSKYYLKSQGIVWVDSELPVNKNTILYILNAMLNKHIKISFLILKIF
jgi:hypothetical protein